MLFGLLDYDLVTGNNLVYDGFEVLIYGVAFSRYLGVYIGHYEQIWFTDNDNTDGGDYHFVCRVQNKNYSKMQ